jgi:glutamate-1-semialdehyde 2,1-aminomutase
VYQAGTLSGNPLATAAGLAALALLDDRAYETLSARAERLASGLAKAFADAGVAVQVPRVASLVGVFFGDDLPVDFDGARRTDEARYAQWFHRMLERGVALAPGAYEVMFPGTTHSDAIIDAIVDEARVVAASLGGG